MEKVNLDRIAIALSVFNEDISLRLKASALDELQKQGIKKHTLVKVPGVVEIPLTAQRLFEKGWPVVVALGCIIRGETSHYLACCRLVEKGCMQVQLKMNKPLIFGILMTENKEQALVRTGGEKGDFGRYSIKAALNLFNSLETIKNDPKSDYEMV